MISIWYNTSHHSARASSLATLYTTRTAITLSYTGKCKTCFGHLTWRRSRETNLCKKYCTTVQLFVRLLFKRELALN